MKNLFSRVVAIALILATVEMALAGTIPKFQNPEGANQVSVKTGTANVGQLLQNAHDHIAHERKWELEPLSSPKVDLIPASDITKYPHVNRYLDLGDSEISHYYILQEDYVFRNLDGRFDKIPAGFIWDGASIPKWTGLPGVLDVGNTRYSSALSEGLIHDYMYRNPQRYTKKEADDLLYDNLVRCKNPNPMKIYLGVDKGGDASYLRHWRNQKEGRYDEFDAEFYANNLKIQRGKMDGSPDKNAVQGSISMEDLKKMNLDDANGDWCKCDDPGCCNTFRVISGKHVGGIRFFCGKCGKVNVEFAKEAVKYERIIKGEGGTPQWRGVNSEEMAKKAAGNAR